MNLMTTAQAAKKWGITQRRVNEYCRTGRIPGVEKLGIAYAIPIDAVKPADPRQGRRKMKNKDVKECKKI